MGLGVPSPPSANLPVSVTNFWVYLFLFLFLEQISCFCALLLITKIMRCLQVVPILCRRPRRSIAKFAPTCYGFNFIDYKRKRVLRVTRLIVMYRTEPPFTYPAWRAHGFQPGTVFPAQCTVRISRVTHLRIRSPSRLRGPLLRFHPQQVVKLPSHRPKSPYRGHTESIQKRMPSKHSAQTHLQPLGHTRYSFFTCTPPFGFGHKKSTHAAAQVLLVDFLNYYYRRTKRTKRTNLKFF